MEQFKKPECSELELYAAKIGLPVLEINKFYDYYESNGWKVGRNKMVSWMGAMRNWKRNYDERKYSGYSRNGGNRYVENPRNFGIARGPTDYAAAAKRKAEEGLKQVGG